MSSPPSYLARQLAIEIMRPCHRYNDEKRIKLLTLLKEERLNFVRADLEECTLFLGFVPINSTAPSWSDPHLPVQARPEVIVNEEKIPALIDIVKKLKLLHQQTTRKLFRPTIAYDSGFGYLSKPLIQWYSLLSDQVSLYFPETDSYTVVERQRLLNVRSDANR
jgi:hypothetical protein